MRKLVLIATLVAVVAGFAMPAHAAGAWTGSINTACTTRLDDFPNNPPAFVNSDNCDNDTGVAPTGGQAIDYALGVIRTQTQTWTGGGQGQTRVRFSYDENCTGVPSGVFPYNGSANGDFLVGGSFQGGGPATLVAGFSWTRLGLTATITFGNTQGGTTDAQTPGGAKTVLAGQLGFDTDGNFNEPTELTAPAGTTAAAVGLLMVQGAIPGASSGGNTCSGTDVANQYEVVTAYAFGGLSG